LRIVQRWMREEMWVLECSVVWVDFFVFVASWSLCGCSRNRVAFFKEMQKLDWFLGQWCLLLFLDFIRQWSKRLMKR
jgi:hypothetical protein